MKRQIDAWKPASMPTERGLQSNAFKDSVASSAGNLQANGLKLISPGQRPGFWHEPENPALKGRYHGGPRYSAALSRLGTNELKDSQAVGPPAALVSQSGLRVGMLQELRKPVTGPELRLQPK